MELYINISQSGNMVLFPRNYYDSEHIIILIDIRRCCLLERKRPSIPVPSEQPWVLGSLTMLFYH